MGAISRIEAQEWATGLAATRRARHKGKAVGDDDADVPTLRAETIAAAVHLMSQLYTMAMREVPPIVTVNPFAALELPAIAPHAIDFLEHDEAEALFDAVEELSGQAARTLTELGTWVAFALASCTGFTGTASTGCAEP
jgi:site-specific recombinase XerD